MIFKIIYVSFLVFTIALGSAEKETTETFQEGDIQEIKAIFIIKLSNTPGFNTGSGSPYNHPFFQGNQPFFGSPYGLWGNYRPGLGGSFGASPNFFGPPPGKIFGPPPGKFFGPPPNKFFGPPPGTVFGPPPGTIFGPPPGTVFGPPPGTVFGPPPGTYFGPYGKFPFWNNPGYSGGLYPTTNEEYAFPTFSQKPFVTQDTRLYAYQYGSNPYGLDPYEFEYLSHGFPAIYPHLRY